MSPANPRLLGKSAGAIGVGSGDLILTSKPSVKYVSIGATGGECYEHSPR
jgi:hypothetical protein